MLKISNLNRKHESGTQWPMEKRVEVVTQYLALGNMRIVSASTGVPYSLIRAWKALPWWKEYEYEIRNTKRSETNNKLSKIIDKSLTIVEDRLENGEIILNNKTGELIRKPVSLKDTLKVTTDLFNQQAAFDKQKIEESTTQQQDTIQDTLKQLAQEFAKFNGSKRPQVIEVEDIKFKETSDAVPEILQEMQPDEVTGLFPTENPQEGW